MRIPWLRRNFLARRRLDRIFLDGPDSVVRRLSGRGHWPPYSLRSFVGDAKDFDAAGRWFVEDLKRLGLLEPGTRILEIGCGCGRLAHPLSAEAERLGLNLSYSGMDIDSTSIEWCRRHIGPLNPQFDFYHADCHNLSYNPSGSLSASTYRFPHADASFDLILLTSVFTHVLPDELVHYFSEIARLLTPFGIAYASFFLYGSDIDSSRHPLKFSVAHEDYAVSLKDFPTNAVAFSEGFVLKALHRAGLKVLGRPCYGSQDILLIVREDAEDHLHLLDGWHQLEKERWRWTGRVFAVGLPPPPAKHTKLRFRFLIADALLKPDGVVRLRVLVNDVELPATEFNTAREHTYVQEIPPEGRRAGQPLVIRFELEKAFSAAGPDERELGLQVLFWTRCNETRKPLSVVEIV
jgi:SAM-dependent methyltransferase